jgi:DNA-binding transcriptional regulator YiaG
LSRAEAQVSEIVQRLRRVRVSALTAGLVSAILSALVVLGLAWVVVSVLDMGVGMASVLLRVIAVLLFAIALGLLAYRVVKIFTVSHSIKMYAARVGRELKDIGLDILTVLDLSEANNEKLGYSDVLISRVIEDITGRVKRFDLEVSTRRRAVVVYSIPLVCLLVATFIWMGTDPASLSYSFARFGYLLGVSPDSGISLTVEPGDDEILAGRDLEIVARVAGFVRQIPVLHVISGGEETAFAMDRHDSLEIRGIALFAGRIARVDRDISYFVTLDGQETRRYRISVYEKPRIKGGSIELIYPAHTGRQQEFLPQGVWDINAPYGTGMEMLLEANCRPDSVWISVADTAGSRRDIPVNAAGDSLRFSHRLTENFTYSVELVAAGGQRAKPHGPHTVKVSADQPPYVRIESPSAEVLLEADMIIPLSVVALDDYGIATMRLRYECLAETSTVELPYRGKTQAECDYDWDVGLLDLFPGDAVNYYVSVADNDALTGPKYARTDVYVARVPTLTELYQEIEERQYEDLDALEEIAEDARQLKDEVRDLVEEMKRTRDIDWEEQQALKQNLAEQVELKERLEEVASSVDETLDLMGENNLVNFEVIAKMEEIRQLLSEVATDDFQKWMERMREAMEKLSPDEIKSAMEKLNFSQEDLLRRLDRTIEMLKRLQVEQRMESLVNLASEIAEGQERVNQGLKEGSDLAELAETEEGLVDQTAELGDMLSDLKEMLNEQRNPVAGDLNNAEQFLRSSQVQEGMAAAMSSMSAGEREEAVSQGENAEQALSQLSMMLQSARDRLMGAEKKEIMEAMTQALHALMDVSRRHEEVLRQIDEPQEAIPPSELARMEMVYKEALDRVAERLFEVSMKSLFVCPQVGRAVLGIGNRLESVSGLLSEGKPAKARGETKLALGAMNELITGLMDAMEQASSCSSPSGMCEAFQNLANMCSMQMGINQGTQQLLGMGQEGLSMEERAGMARLAAEQEAVKKGIEDMAGEFGSRAEILGRLDDLSEEARNVIEDLRRRKVSEETLRRQERILTRLLNAQRSMRRRDYSQRRKSRPGEAYEVVSPPELSLEDKERMLRDLLYRRRGYYPPEYEDLIRAYFRTISREAGSR